MLITAWLAGPPSVRAEAAHIQGVVDEVLSLFSAYGIRSVWTSEPRSYRTGPSGRAALSTAIAEGRVDDLVILPPWQDRPTADATFHLTLPTTSWVATSLRLTVELLHPTDLSRVSDEVMAFVHKWFGPLSAASAFVSSYWIEDGAEYGDHPTGTAYERQRREGSLLTWTGVRRFARGVFWGTGLGPDLCAHLGGRERVLRQAPAPIARPLGEGVWLQLSAVPPADAEGLTRLAEFLSPLLNWTSTELQALAASADAELPAEQPSRHSDPKSLPPAIEATFVRARLSRKGVPMQRLGRGSDTAVGLNVYLAAAPSPPQRDVVVEAVDGWYADGFQGVFGGAGFHQLSGLTVDGSVLRWYVDLGSADDREALRSLARRLADLPSVQVLRLVVGTETA